MKNYWKLARVHHYIKNLLILFPLACSGQILNEDKLLFGLVGALAFCMMSSAIYVINDIRDSEKDKKHPIKCHRPIAAGQVSRKGAIIFAVLLFALSAFCHYFVFDLVASLLLGAYLLLNLLYSFGLKNIPILDVAILASGFLIRILYGAEITDIAISHWLYLTVIAMALYLALGKRRGELKQSDTGETRPVLAAYTVGFLDKNMTVCLALVNVFYALWSLDAKTASLYNNAYMVFTVPIVLLITMKYSLSVEKGSDGDPVEVLLHDKVLLGLCLLWGTVMALILYL